MDDHDDIEPNCRNCGAELQGRYCHECGQEAVSSQLTFHHFVHEATHEFLHLDGKIFRTLKTLVLKPGALTSEFLAGRRAQYISPLRVYLTCSLLFFFIAALSPNFRASTIQVKSKNPTATEQEEVERAAERIGESVLHNAPRAMFALMPLFGLLTWAFYRKQQPFYVPHLYYAVHFHAFCFLMLAIYAALLGAGRPGKLVGSLLLLTFIPYHFIGLRRVFGGTRGSTFAKGLAVGLIYWVTVLAALLAIFYAALQSLPAT